MLLFFLLILTPNGRINVFMEPKQLKEERLRLGLTQSEFADRLMTPFETYSKWERGVRRIPGMIEVALKTVKDEVKKERSEEG